MRPLYDARVSDLGPDDFVQVECGCGHKEQLTAAMLATAGVAPYRTILDLRRSLKYSACRWRGRADVTIRWAG